VVDEGNVDFARRDQTRALQLGLDDDVRPPTFGGRR
jgi:hypothetical protein